MTSAYRLLLALVLLVAIACEKGEKIPQNIEGKADKADTAKVLITKVTPAWRISIDRPNDTSKVLPPQPRKGPGSHLFPTTTMVVYALDSSKLRTPIEPEFTDASVGMLIGRTAAADPDLIETCIIPRLKDWVTAIMGGTTMAPLNLPWIMDPAGDCASGTMVAWRYSPSQTCIWRGTDAATNVAEQLMDRLREYQTICKTLGMAIPLTIEGLNYGSSYCRSARGVRGYPVYDGTGAPVEYRIVFLY
jgi:hypothetical protein